MRAFASTLLGCALLAAPASAIQDTMVTLDSAVVGIPNLTITAPADDPIGNTYSVTGAGQILILPVSSIADDGDILHLGGAFLFSDGMTELILRDWIYELGELDPVAHLADVDVNTEDFFRMEMVDLAAGTAQLTFTAQAADDFNEAFGTSFSEFDLFGVTHFVPEPGTASLLGLGLLGLTIAGRRKPSL
jgi:hypothetical protein